MYRIDKLNTLLKEKQELFHTQDLASLWEIENRNTLYTTIKRYVDKGVIIPVHKGLYSVIPLENLDKRILGTSLIHGYSYLSCESILAKEGIINQSIYGMTFNASKSTKIAIGKEMYIFRKIKDAFLYNTTGIIQNNGVFEANLERAVADMLYFNPKYHFDNRDLIDWQKVSNIQKEVGYK